MSRKKAGFTLVEAVTAAAIIAVCSAMLWSGYRSSLALMRSSADLQRESDTAFALAQAGGERLSGAVSFKAGGEVYTIDGEFVRGSSGRAVYYSFRAGGDLP